MRQGFALFVAIAFALSAPGLALAQGGYPGMNPKLPGDTPGQDKPAKPTASSLRGQHSEVGEITKLDASKGMLTLKTAEGDLNLHFPPAALRGLKEGDRVEVQMGLRPAGAAGKTSKTPESKSSPARPAPGVFPGGTPPGTPPQPQTQ